jgi:hypothetical protein
MDYFPFNVVSNDEAIVTNLVTQIMQCLAYHEMANVAMQQAKQTKLALQKKRDTLSRWYFIGIVFAFLLLGFALTGASVIRSTVSKAMANVWDVFASYIPDMPLTAAIQQMGRSTANAFLLRWPGWEDVNPLHIYTAVSLGVPGIGEYATVFWAGGYFLGLALYQWTRTLGDWCALGHIRSIDSSPELAWDAEIEIIIDQENRQRSIVILNFIGSLQAWLQAGQAIRAALGHIVWTRLYPVLPQLVGRNRTRAPAVLQTHPRVQLLEDASSTSFVPRLEHTPPQNDRMMASLVLRSNRNVMLALPAPKPTSTYRVEEVDSDVEL